jgi:hypothetical protein
MDRRRVLRQASCRSPVSHQRRPSSHWLTCIFSMTLLSCVASHAAPSVPMGRAPCDPAYTSFLSKLSPPGPIAARRRRQSPPGRASPRLHPCPMPRNEIVRAKVRATRPCPDGLLVHLFCHGCFAGHTQSCGHSFATELRFARIVLGRTNHGIHGRRSMVLPPFRISPLSLAPRIHAGCSSNPERLF